jgi:excisionase family DNA binding protein
MAATVEMSLNTLTLPGAAERIGISERHLKRMLAKGEGPNTVRLGRRRLIRPESLDDWLKSHEQN